MSNLNNLNILKSTVPEVVDSAKRLYAASPKDFDKYARHLCDLTERIFRAYPEEIANAIFLVSAVRFKRWAKDYREKTSIQAFLREVSA